MNTPRPEQQIFRRNLKLAPYFGSIGGVLALVLGFWTPFYIAYLVLAALVGGIVFFIAWLGLRRRAYLGPVSVIVWILSLMLGSGILIPQHLPHWVSGRCTLQGFGVSMFVLAALHLVYRNRIKSEVEPDSVKSV